MKKILISTLPLGSNYGGIMQAYAMQSTVSSLGYVPETTYSKGVIYKRIARLLPGLNYLYALSRGTAQQKKVSQVDTKNTQRFIDKYIDTVGFDRACFRSMTGHYVAFIAGSDQVWRGVYAYVPHNLFSYVKGGVKISYAASFGRDDLEEYSNKLVARTRSLARKMTAISVREDSAVGIVEKYWGLESEHHVDPTLLIERSEYNRLILEDKTNREPQGDTFVYVLDTSKNTRAIIDKVLFEIKAKPFNVINGDGHEGGTMPPVTQWLRSFRDSRFVVTDSFHGTVFSIIFNKPFISIGNKTRGLARFTSLLKIFGLEGRLVDSPSSIDSTLVNSEIDWARINELIKLEKKRSLGFLKNNLEEKS